MKIAQRVGWLKIMSTSHSIKAKEFLKNQTYAHWHDDTFWAVRSKRDKMAYGLDEWEQLREKASEIKRHHPS